MTYQIGMILDGVVTGIQPYGVFVSLGNQTQGLIHVSEIQSGFTKNIEEVLEVGQKIKVQIIDIDEYSQKISLSRRTLEMKFTPNPSRKKRYFTNRNKQIGFASVEKMIPIWTSEALTMLKKEKPSK